VGHCIVSNAAGTEAIIRNSIIHLDEKWVTYEDTTKAMNKNGVRQENPDWGRSEGDHIPIDQTVTIRIKKRKAIIRGVREQCPYCGNYFSHYEMKPHKLLCNPSIAPTTQPPKLIVRNDSRSTKCKYCATIVLNKSSVMMRHLESKHRNLNLSKSEPNIHFRT
jgi:hypothetical protein